MAAQDTSKQNRLVMIAMGAFLVFGAVLALTQPAGEFPPTAYAIFNIALDAVMVLLMAILIFANLRSPPGGLKAVATGIGVIGLIAGLVQVGIRFTSDHAWWTGNYPPPVFN